MTLDDLTRWQRRISDWQSAEHTAYIERCKDVCDACELKIHHDCIGSMCPLNSTLDELNRAPKKMEKTTKYIYDNLVRKHQDV